MSRRGDRPRDQVDDPQFVRAEAAMQHGCPATVRMHRQPGGKVTQLDLTSGGTDRPLAVQQRRAVGLQSGQQRLRLRVGRPSGRGQRQKTGHKADKFHDDRLTGGAPGCNATAGWLTTRGNGGTLLAAS